MCWEAEKAEEEGEVFWKLSARGNIRWVPILCYEDWSAISYEWWGPALGRSHMGDWPSSGLVLARQTRPSEPLLRAACRGSFVGIGVTGVRQIARSVGCAIGRGASLGAILQELTNFILGAQTDEAMLEILTKRLAPSHELADLVKTTDFGDLLTNDDLAAMQQCENEHEQREVAQKDLVSELKALRERIEKSRNKGGRSSASSSSGVHAAIRQRKYPARVPEPGDKWSEAFVESLLPPGARVLKDMNNQRWLLSCEGARRSRSWGLYGFGRSALLIARIAWQLWEQAGHSPRCPIEGLLELEEAVLP